MFSFEIVYEDGSRMVGIPVRYDDLQCAKTAAKRASFDIARDLLSFGGGLKTQFEIKDENGAARARTYLAFDLDSAKPSNNKMH